MTTEGANARLISIRGACEHNLKNLNLDLPREKFIVITGVSGSGKSSLAFDTIYAEGQRRYMESLSSYARQFLDQMHKPAIESIAGLPPTISIEQRRSSANPRSIVATITEIYDYMRLLWARIGVPHCPTCGGGVERQSPARIAGAVAALLRSGPVLLMAPVVDGRKGLHVDAFEMLMKEGFVRARVDGAVLRIPPVPALDRNRKHDVAAVVDRFDSSRSCARIPDSVETALRIGKGRLIAASQDGGGFVDAWFSEVLACAKCGTGIPEPAPRMFSFNSPHGACAECDGLGTRLELDPDLVVPDRGISVSNGAIEPLRRLAGAAHFRARMTAVLRGECGVDVAAPFGKLPAAHAKLVLYGSEAAGFEGVIPHLMRRFERTGSEYLKRRIHEYMSELPCPSCGGARLKPGSLAVTVMDRNISEAAAMGVEEARGFFRQIKPREGDEGVAGPVLREIAARLDFLANVGLGYLALDRRAGTLSGGEAQRIRLASQVGSALVGVCYVLDEPTIGLHQRDNSRLLATLKALRDLDNTVIVVEHDLETIRSADWVVDVGPGPGEEGGNVVGQGSPEDLASKGTSLTARFLRGDMVIAVPAARRPVDAGRCVEILGAAENNLKRIDVRFPLGVITCVTGVSGSGKSSLVSAILLRSLRRKLHASGGKPGIHRAIKGWKQLDKVVEIDQSPIGRTSRSNPATYTGCMDEIRRLFALTREARARGYGPGRFSFNRPGGRCEACEGHGTRRIEMHFLPDVTVECAECKGRRYNDETLKVRYKDLSIADVLDMSVRDATGFFANHRSLLRMLETLMDVGMGYVRLGQPSPTLSGGEAQRVKLSAELARPQTGNALYVLDEPTTGLHLADISKLLDVLRRLCDRGNTIVVIEHNLDVVKTADHVIDLGPEGGAEGGRLVASGTPEEVAMVPESHTGAALGRVLAPGRQTGDR